MQVSHYFSKSSAEETSRREELIAKGSCCGENCRDCPYAPKHTKGITALKDPAEKHVTATPPAWEPEKKAYEMSPEAQAHYDRNYLSDDQLAAKRYQEAEQANAQQKEQAANAEAQRFAGLSYPQKFLEQGGKIMGPKLTSIGEGMGSILPYFSKAMGRGIAWPAEVGGHALQFAGDTVEHFTAPFAKARALQQAAQTAKPGDADYDRLKYYKDVGLLEAAKGYRQQNPSMLFRKNPFVAEPVTNPMARKGTSSLYAPEAPGSFFSKRIPEFFNDLTGRPQTSAPQEPGRGERALNQSPKDLFLPEMYLHSNSNWSGGGDGINSFIKDKVIPWDQPVAGFARGALGIPARVVGGVSNSAQHAWDAASANNWKFQPDTKTVANPNFGNADPNQYLTLQAQGQRGSAGFGDWNNAPTAHGPSNAQLVADNIRNEEQFEKDTRPYWDKVTDMKPTGGQRADGTPNQAFKYPGMVEFNSDMTTPRPKGTPPARIPLNTPNNILGKPGQYTAVKGNPAYNPGNGQQKYLNLSPQATPPNLTRR